MASSDIASRGDVGALGIKHLKRLWSSTLATQAGIDVDREDEWHLDRMLLDALGLSLHQTLQYLFQYAPTFPEFEDWVVTTAGHPSQLVIARFNAGIAGTPEPGSVCDWLDRIDDSAPVLSDDDLSFWEENGYVVVKDAVSPEHREAAETAIWNHIDAQREDPSTWYRATDQGIMVELIQHPALQANRSATRVHKAFAQLWGTTDLWVSADRCGFHPPQRDDHPFPGPDLHWDIDFAKPLTFATQGILYLTDTVCEQGALTLVPGFQRRMRDWLQQLEPGGDPNAQDLNALGSIAVAGQAGDMIIWNQLLPHGASPNQGKRPRIVQYLNMYPMTGSASTAY